MREQALTIVTHAGPMQAFAAHPAGDGRHPAVVVEQEAFGVNDHIRDVCRRLAREGYVAVAPELFHRTGPGVTVPYDTVPAAMALLATLSNEGLEDDLASTLRDVRALPDVDPDHVGLLGFCVGGFAAFLGACRLDPAATVSYYGGGIARQRPNLALRPLLDEASRIRAPILCLFGAEDAGITPDDIAAIQARLDELPVAHDVTVYPGAGHAFACDARPAYRPEPAAAAWTRTLAWFSGHLHAAR